jgi:hypothetical protein
MHGNVVKRYLLIAGSAPIVFGTKIVGCGFPLFPREARVGEKSEQII